MLRTGRVALALFASVLYLCTALPGQGWLDTSEFIAGAHTLGIVHPPGHPLYMMLAKGFALLVPVGSIAFRINLLSAVLGVVCVLLVAEITRRVARALDDERAEPRETETNAPGHALVGLGAGALFAVTDALWLQSVRAEVYTLHAALILGALLLAVQWYRSGGRSRILAAAVLLGLALSNHHYLVFFFAPAPLLMLAVTQKGRAILASTTTVLALGLAIVTLLAYAYLPIRSGAEPEIDWTHPTTVERFVDTLSARTFQGALDAEERGAPISENLLVAADMMAGQLTPIGLFLGLLGLLYALRRAPPLGGLLVAALAFNLLTKAIVYIDPLNPDDYGYYLLSVALLTIGVGLVPTAVATLVPASSARFVPHLGTACLVVGAIALAGATWSRVGLRHDVSAEAVTDVTLDRAGPDAVLFVNFYALFFNHWHARLVDRRRPDVAVVHATFDHRRYEGRPYVEALRRRHPDLGPVVDDYLDGGGFPMDAVAALARSRPVLIEPMLEPTPDARLLEPAGVLRRWKGTPTPDSGSARENEAQWRRLDARLNRPLHREARKVLAWHQFLSAVQALRAGAPQTASVVLQRTAELSNDPAVDRLIALANGMSDFDRKAERDGPDAPFRRARRAVRAAMLHGLNYERVLTAPETP